MIISDLLRAIVVLALILVRRPDQVWIIYGVTLLEISLSAFFSPAKSAIIPNIVKNQELVTANALSSITWSVMLTLGAALGGIVSAVFNHDTAFLINSLSFLFSAIMIWLVRTPDKAEKIEETYPELRHPIKEFIDGIKYIINKRDVFAYVFLKSGWGLAGGIVLVITIFGQRIFPIGGSPDAGIGILYSARGFGTAVGPILARKIAGNSQKGMRDWIGYGFIIGGLFLIGFGLSTNIWVACLTLFLSHLGTSIMWVFSTTLLQLNTEDYVRGRVFSTEFAIFTLTMSISNYLTGLGLDIPGLNPEIIVYLLGLIIFLPGLIWLSLLFRWDAWINKRKV